MPEGTVLKYIATHPDIDCLELVSEQTYHHTSIGCGINFSTHSSLVLHKVYVIYMNHIQPWFMVIFGGYVSWVKYLNQHMTLFREIY